MKSGLLFVYQVALVGCAQPTAPASAPPSQPPLSTEARLSAESILGTMTERYANCRSYQDSGTLQQSIVSARSKEPSRSTVTFRTAFLRQSAQFYFDYQEMQEPRSAADRAVIWRRTEGPASHWWTTAPNETEQLELSHALRASAGVSHGLTTLVPMWLTHAERCLPALHYQREGDEAVRGISSFKLFATSKDRTVTLWLRKSDSALVRFKSSDVIPPRHEATPDAAREILPPEMHALIDQANSDTLSTEDVIDFEPTFDAPVAEATFLFSPPTAAAASSTGRGRVE